MKNLLILVMVLVAFGGVNAQSIIYKRNPEYSYTDDWIKVGKYENGIVYKRNPEYSYTDDWIKVGKYENGIVYKRNPEYSYTDDWIKVGKVNSGPGAAGFLLLLR